MSRSTPFLCALATLGTLASTADADEPAPAAAAASDDSTTSSDSTASDDDANESKIHFAVQRPPHGDSRTYHRHDGFYVRTNLGMAHLWATLDDGSDQNFDVDVKGNGMSVDLLIGGTPNPGLTLGGGLIGNWSFGAKYQRQGVDIPDRDYQDLTIGAFVDGFPRDTGGWHLGALLGLSGVNVKQDGYVKSMGGLGGAVWGGYDQWVADDWALGGLLRLTMNQTSGKDNGYDVSAGTWTLGLSFSALYQ